MKRLPSIVFSLLTLASGLRADVSVSPLFSDHAVLLKAEKVPIWGKADPGEKVKVTLDGTTAETEAGADGKWRVNLNLQDKARGPFELIVEGKNKFAIRDVVVGEVWLCSGQSNMEYALGHTDRAEIPKSANPMLRHFAVKKAATIVPLEEVSGRWVVAGPSTSGNFTAVGYWFGKTLNRELDAPVGLINASWGTTHSEHWTSPGAIDTDPHLKARREELFAQIRAAPGLKDPDPKTAPAAVYNGMIAPLIPYAIRGAIWYQGEGNARRAYAYRMAFPLLISDWRAQWGRGDFPFYFCQLANHKPKAARPGEDTWAELREAQSMARRLPNTGMAVLIDIGETKEIHPRNKKDAGERLAAIALARDYGKKIPFAGPAFDSMRIEGNKAVIRFKNIEGGLVAKPLPAEELYRSSPRETGPLFIPRPDSELQGFAICGEDRQWKWADAKIEGDTVVVSSEEVPRPVAVRYAWASNPTCNLYNKAGFPAEPFRTDDFPTVTLDRKF